MLPVFSKIIETTFYTKFKKCLNKYKIVSTKKESQLQVPILLIL